LRVGYLNKEKKKEKEKYFFEEGSAPQDGPIISRH
jgi:hypothetical protein